jgi:chemotaxis protein MotA
VRLDIATLAGLAVGLGGILVGNALEGGHLSSIVQPTAALIVFGGTLGAVLVSFPMGAAIDAAKSAVTLIGTRARDAHALLEEIVGYARKARKDGIVSLEKEIKTASDPFLSRAIMLGVDGIDSQAMRETLEFDLAEAEERGEMPAKVFEAAGGYAPTIGILGAVLGLIHVMSNLSDVSKVGEGIAVAFVATIYGVGAANLLFLPAAAKLKINHRQTMKLREMILEGAIAIQQGQNPKLIESKLQAFIHTAPPKKEPAADKQPAAATAGA